MIYITVILLIVSVVFNIFLVWYAKNLLVDLVAFSSRIGDLKHNVEVFEEHLNSISKMELFSNEPVIKGLCEHTKEMAEFLSGIEDVFVEEGVEIEPIKKT